MTDRATDMRAVVARHPGLTPDGFAGDSTPATMFAPDMLDAFERCIGWLRAAPRTRRPLVGSYWLACVLTRLTRADVPHGAVIAAAIHLDIKFRPSGSNALLGISLPWVRAEDERSHAGTLGFKSMDEVADECDSEDRALRAGLEAVGHWRIAPKTREIAHARVDWYAIDLDRVRSESDALAMVVHISRKRGVFDDADVGALAHLFRSSRLPEGRSRGSECEHESDTMMRTVFGHVCQWPPATTGRGTH
jgi:hypothetical protein